jgi:aconitate decarboxylase
MTHTPATSSDDPSDPSSPTGQLSTWISSLTYNDIQEDLRTRAKYFILDGIACALVGAHLPWSEKAAKALLELELTEGSASVIGYERRINALNAAMLNSSFIQGFELDDWHTGAPLHSNSIILPALLAAADHLSLKSSTSSANSSSSYSGRDFIVAYIAGLEVGPRVGLALHGPHMLSMGWHSGAVFGPPASAAAVGKFLGLSAGAIEDAFGIACTQAGGLMSAQFESEVKRMQHGFAARSGLLGAILAQTGYVGIKRVFEREYGGFLKQLSSGNGMEPQYKVEEIAKDLGQKWLMEGVAIKPYASMAGTHNTVDCLTDLRVLYPELLSDLYGIERILIELSKPAFEHGGWEAKRPLTATGAQMSNAYVAATYLVDSAVLPAQFSAKMIERDLVWDLVGKTTCELNTEFGKLRTRVSIWLKGRSDPIVADRELSKSVMPTLTNDEILEKWRNITANVIDDERRQRIEDVVLNLEDYNDLGVLSGLLMGVTKNPIG